LALIAVIISITLLFWIIIKQRQTHRLKQKIAELTATNKMLRQKVDELKREQVDILEDIIEAEPPTKKIPGFNPQELKALAELARRLR
jgi:cell division protein FtsB